MLRNNQLVSQNQISLILDWVTGLINMEEEHKINFKEFFGTSLYNNWEKIV